MASSQHTRIEQMAAFYRDGPKVCSFMSPDVTRFVWVPEGYSAKEVGEPIVQWAKTGQPSALAYVWERDPLDFKAERSAAIGLFGTLQQALFEDQTGQGIEQLILKNSVSDDSRKKNLEKI